jgi:hypothetical protein
LWIRIGFNAIQIQGFDEQILLKNPCFGKILQYNNP